MYTYILTVMTGMDSKVVNAFICHLCQGTWQGVVARPVGSLVSAFIAYGHTTPPSSPSRMRKFVPRSFYVLELRCKKNFFFILVTLVSILALKHNMKESLQ